MKHFELILAVIAIWLTGSVPARAQTRSTTESFDSVVVGRTITAALNCDGVTDNRPLIAQLVNKYSWVQLVPKGTGACVTSPITGVANVHISGPGMTVPGLQLKSGSNAPIISFTNVRNWSVSELTFDCNHANGTAPCFSVYNNAGDQNFQMVGVTINNSSANGLQLGGNRYSNTVGEGAGSITRLRVYYADGIGVVANGWDVRWEDIDVGHSGLQGVYMAASAQQFSHLKVWMSGRIAPERGHGFQIDKGPAIVTAISGSDIVSQDNQACGFLLSGMGTALSALVAHNNNQSNSGWAGVCAVNMNASNISGHATGNSDIPKRQSYALSLVNSSNNIIKLTSDNHVHGLVTGTTANNSIEIMDYKGFFVQLPGSQPVHSPSQN